MIAIDEKIGDFPVCPLLEFANHFVFVMQNKIEAADRGNPACRGSICMMWRNINSKSGAGYCGLAGEPSDEDHRMLQDGEV